jgi:PQQ-like domain
VTRAKLLSLFVAAAVACASPPAYCQQESVLTFHGHADRSGHFVVPKLTWEQARSVHLDDGFRARVSGHVYAQPLYWREGGSNGMLLVATEEDTVHALDALTGREIWTRPLGKPVRRSALACGNIDPLGITGTPAIDARAKALYLNAAIEGSRGPRHLIFALSLADGSTLPGWPVDVADALASARESFDQLSQNQRGALAIANDRLYVPFGGHFGDCGRYHGWVVGVSLVDPARVTSWATRARGGGIWAPGGISVADGSLFVATGNTFAASAWADGEAVIRPDGDLRRSDSTRDFFAPADWRALDARDADLGGTAPVPLDVPAENGSQALMLALGKDRRAYLLDRNDLGGIGGSLAAEAVSERIILAAPAVYRVGEDVFVAFQSPGARCPNPARGKGLTVLKVHAGSPPSLTTIWCGALAGAGSPIVTTTDGRAEPIVWIVGAEGDDRLHGFRGDTGEPLLSGNARALAGLRHFQTLIATHDRLYVAADGRVYAFSF